jgi:hypothetical protein
MQDNLFVKETGWVRHGTVALNFDTKINDRLRSNTIFWIGERNSVGFVKTLIMPDANALRIE